MLSYYKTYLQQIEKKAIRTDKKLINKYNKYSEYSKNSQCGGEFSEKPIDIMQNKVTKVNETLERLEKISPYVKRYKNRISNLIQEIEKVHNAGGDHISGGLNSAKLDKMMKDLDTMNNDIIMLLDKETFRIHSDKEIHSNILMKSDKESWENILIIYRMMIANFNELFVQSKSLKLHMIYEQVLINVEKNSKELDQLEAVIDEYEINIRSKTGSLLDNIDTVYDPNLIMYTQENIAESEFKIKITFNTEILSPTGANYEELKTMTNQLIDYYYNSSSVNISINESSGAYDSVSNLVGNERKTLQIGGISDEEMNNHQKETQNIIKLKTSLTELSRKFEKVNIKIGTSQELHNSYEQYRIRYSYYLMYLIMIMTKTQTVREQYIFKYIDKKTIKLYYDIITDILNKVENMDKTTIILFFSTYHYFTLIKMKSFCKFLIQYTPDANLVDIFNCGPKLLTSFTLFNNFKDLLDSYKKQ